MSDIEIHDYISADQIEDGDQVSFVNSEGGIDYIEVNAKTDSGDAIMVKGYSHVTGDSVFYIWSPDQEVGLWSV